MCEEGTLRGDDITFRHGVTGEQDQPDADPLPMDQMLGRTRVDLMEPDREGDEMTGDEHSSGLQGGEPELDRQPHWDSGIPGDFNEREDLISELHLLTEGDETIPRQPPRERRRTPLRPSRTRSARRSPRRSPRRAAKPKASS